MKTKNSKNFILKKEYLGKGFTIIVDQGFRYNHDDLFKNQQHRFLKGGSASHSWTIYGEYKKTSGYPSWANDFVSFDKEIKPPFHEDEQKMLRKEIKEWEEEIVSITKKGLTNIKNSPNAEDDQRFKDLEKEIEEIYGALNVMVSIQENQLRVLVSEALQTKSTGEYFISGDALHMLELKLKKIESDLKQLRIAIIALFILIASILYMFW